MRSHFLVKEGIRINARGNSNPTLSVDRVDKSAERWKRADILVFNTGHWWTHRKTARGYALFSHSAIISLRYPCWNETFIPFYILLHSFCVSFLLN